MFQHLILVGLFVCTASAPSGRVVNGTDADIEDYPFMTKIRDGYTHKCGGSILNERWVLTAAHCSGDNIYYGSANATDGERISIILWIRHEKYNIWTLENDIAVVLLSEPITFGNESQPVELPEPMFEVPGSWEVAANLTGFGYAETEGTIQSQLQETELLVVSNDDCSQIHGREIHPGMLCAGVEEGGRGQCSGDSGSPLTIDGMQIGVVSWSVKPCAVAPYPGVYTKVSHYIDWIIEKTGLEI